MLWDPWDPLARHQYVCKRQTNKKSVQLDWCTDAYQGAFRVCLIYRKLLLLLRSSGTVASFTFGAPPWKLNPVCWVPWQVEMGPGMSSQKWCTMQGFQCDRHTTDTWPTCNHSAKELVEDARAWPVQGDLRGWSSADWLASQSQWSQIHTNTIGSWIWGKLDTASRIATKR